jgi:hypothetical protein
VLAMELNMPGNENYKCSVLDNSFKIVLQVNLTNQSGKLQAFEYLKFIRRLEFGSMKI